MESIENQEGRFFSDLLKQFRQRKKLTQQQLAKQIGASRESVSLWERGQFKPDTITTVHEIARVLDLDDDEKRLLFEAHLGTASILPLHNFPEHNPYFTGREAILRNLHMHLTAGTQVALIQAQAISGLGGIGKTQTAIEYAYRFREHYHDILWIAADTREMLMTSYLTLARYLRLREREEREQHKVVEAVKRWLREHKGWLLILDNIEDLSLVSEFVPSPRQGAVMLTTRRKETKPVAHPLQLDIMPEEEGILFLLKRAGYLSIEASLEMTTTENTAAAKAIVHMVGGLPLAIDQAGAYIAETKCRLSDYFDLFKQEQKVLLQRRGSVSSDHPDSVTTTFSLAFEQVQQKNEAAIELLKLCAYLAPDTIPLELISLGAVHLGSVLEPVAANALHLDQMLETLQAYSLLQRDRENRTLSIHRLVQSVLQDTIKEVERKTWIERTIIAINAAFPQVEHSTWPQCERLLSHAMLAAYYININQFMNEEAGYLLHETAIYLRERARYSEAEPLFKQALQVKEQHLGPKHTLVATSLTGLANLYRMQGKYVEAEPLFQQAIGIYEQQPWPEHAQIAYSLNGLAILYQEQGKYIEAEPLYLRASAIWEQQWGSEHPQIAHPLNNLAALYKEQGKYVEAEPLYLRALSIWEQQLGPNHPQVAYPLHNLATLYKELGKYIEAEPLYLRASAIWEQQLGPDHPQVGVPLNSLANLYKEQGKYKKAEPLYLRALSIWEQQLGLDHPLVAHSLSELANLYFDQKKYMEAEPLYLRALYIREKTLGPQHAETAETTYGFAQLREAQGYTQEACDWYTRTLAIQEQGLGAQHPKTVKTRNHFIFLLHAIEQHEKAAQLEATHHEQITSEEESETHPEE